MIPLKYENLDQLIRGSSSSRRYFMSLPVEMQLALHQHGDSICTAEQLHRLANAIPKHRRQVEISGFRYF